MTKKALLIKVLEVLDSGTNIRKEMSDLLDVNADESGLNKMLIYEIDYKSYICNRFFEWEYGSTIEKRVASDESYRAPKRNTIINRNEAKSLSEILSSRNFLVLNDYVDDRVASLFAKITGSYVEDSVVVPLISSGEQVGFILYDERVSSSSESELDGNEFFVLITRMVGAYFKSRKSDAESRMKSEFLSRMSHEIRTPMNAIIGMTDIAQKSLNDIGRVGDCLTKIDSSTKYLLSLINDILDMSKIESGKMEVGLERFSIDRVLDSIGTLMTPQAQNKHIALKIIREYTDSDVVGDELKVNQVLINLIGNALKFTPENGKIIVRVEEILSEDDYVVLRFLVKDSGCGIEPRDIDRIFKAFEQASTNVASLHGGTGLGLSISYNLVKLMGGELQVSSTVGKGSDFYFTLSFKRATDVKADGEDTEVDNFETEESNYDFTGRRVLVAEDNELNAEIAQTVLEMVGFEAETAANGQIAVEMFRNNDEHYYDAILMDIRMPVMDGLEATKRIRESSLKYAKSVPILAMTANAFDEDMKKSLKCGMDGHLSKPVDTQKLYSELKRVISYRNGD